ncbi:MAG: DEAD/DEAH box helicase [Sarcina sp.]
MIVDKYLRYIGTTFHIKDEIYKKKLDEKLKEKKYFAKGPYIDFIDSFKTGRSLNELIEQNIISSSFRKLFIGNEDLLARSLYKHQEKALIKSIENKNLVITTGTGSGKTESFLFPVLNYLMREDENKTLCDGVRALIIYPMNALANDQMKRMRELLKNYPDISFGLYTGETEKEDKKAIAKYKSLNNNEAPLQNERISRNQMQKKPPHVLITNYAMLEYLMLRPADNVFFNSNNSKFWKYIVLDEAHTYSGANGIEVSMLLRRVKNLLEDNNKINFMLTSATLGGKENITDICDFASRLCDDSIFDENSVIMAERHNFDNIQERKKININIYKVLKRLLEIEADIEEFKLIATKNDIDISDLNNIKEIIFEIVKSDKTYYKLRGFLKDDPKTLEELQEQTGLEKEEIINFIEVASKAENKGVKLLDAKYHMFIRTLEGIYVSLKPHKDLSIIPREFISNKNEKLKAYKITMCKFCGQVYLKGKKESLDGPQSYFKQSKKSFDSDEKVYVLFEGEDSELTDEEYENLQTICSKCSRITSANIINGSWCECGEQYKNKMIEVNKKADDLSTCLTCGSVSIKGGVLREFYLGQEAATSVVCTGLYNELPSRVQKRVKREKVNIDKEFIDFFGEEEESVSEEIFDIIESNISKQLLVFSDSRQDAAYFASYFDFTYNNILRRRLLIESIKRNESLITEDGLSIKAIVKDLSVLFEKNKIFVRELAEKEAWKTVLHEIVTSDRNSLENLGLISVEFKGKKGSKLGEYKDNEVVAIQNFLAESFRKDGIVFSEIDEMLSIADREFYMYNGLQLYMCLNILDKDKYCKSWLADSKHKNNRAKYIMKTLDCSIQRANEFLAIIWEKLYIPQKFIEMKKTNQYLMNINHFTIKVSDFLVHNNPSARNLKWYYCDKCGKITTINIKNYCTRNRCDGILVELESSRLLEENHYIKQYSNLDIYPMRIKEHTAQLAPKTAQVYQQKFVNKEINILSCSTTFEMGVDVGELETVFMKNMPPTPANYIQRAGRAGRRSDSVAYSLTFCKLSSHDLNYFKNPNKMIKGKIMPPKFKIKNEKIIRRHINAVIIASFWRRYKELFADVKTFFEINNFELLKDYIKELPISVLEYLKSLVKSMNQNIIELWVNELIDNKSILVRAFEEYTDEIKELNKIKKELIGKSENSKVGWEIIRIDKYKERLADEQILQFLSRKNIIPKYGFPVDTVELTTTLTKESIQGFSKDSTLRLQRDLMIAISDYAPGSEIIADGKIYKSQYIKKSTKNDIWLEYNFGECTADKCNHMNIRLKTNNDFSTVFCTCDVCNSKVEKTGSYIVPEYGFIISNDIKEATSRKPKKTYTSEIYYIGDKNKLNGEKEIFIDGECIKIKSTENDSLFVVNNSNFYVCKQCGYGEVKKNYSIRHKKHYTAQGKKCSNEILEEKRLGHTFKTDVVQIKIPYIIEHEQARAILYSILEGASSYLDIERTDISGCIENRVQGGEYETSFILFDTVPGGAGHVRRIGLFENRELIEMFKSAYKIVSECTCGEEEGNGSCYSCLCNYYNQQWHDILKRKNAISFLKKYI